MENENVGFLTVILKYGLVVLLIMAIIFALAVLTPWMAKQVDKIIARMKKKENPVQQEEDSRCAQVKGIYDMPDVSQSDAQLTEDTSQTKEEE